MRTVEDRPVTRERKRSTFPALLLGIVLGLIAFAVFAHRAKTGIWDRFASVVTGRGLTIDNSSAVVNKIQRLQRLETVSYSLDKIVEGDRQNPILPDFLVGDKLLMVVHGEVIAGIDLSQLKPNDVHVQGRAVQVHLPAAQIFVTTLDNTKTRVYSRTYRPAGAAGSQPRERSSGQSAAADSAGRNRGWNPDDSREECPRHDDFHADGNGFRERHHRLRLLPIPPFVF